MQVFIFFILLSLSFFLLFHSPFPSCLLSCFLFLVIRYTLRGSFCPDIIFKFLPSESLKSVSSGLSNSPWQHLTPWLCYRGSISVSSILRIRMFSGDSGIGSSRNFVGLSNSNLQIMNALQIVTLRLLHKLSGGSYIGQSTL